MADFTLVIANKNYSSWSMRPWLCMKAAGVAFEEIVVPLDGADSEARIRAHSPTGKVPVLVHGDVVVWESLAICEYLAELFPSAGLWPSDRAARAHARAAASEMHAGFGDLRSRMAMNVRARFPRGTGLRAPGVEGDVARVQALWSEARERFGSKAAGAQAGLFLYGRFGVADAMFAPVATRFVTYDVPLEGPARAYVDALMAHPAVAAWIEAGAAEPWRVAKYENP